MKADLSRDSFDRRRHDSAVRLQQGRIVTDADWNEQADIGRYRAERQALDVIGHCGGPVDGAGYALVAETHALAVLALAADRAWAAGEDGTLLDSSDGGTTWTLRDTGSAAHVRALASAGGTGWLVGDGGLVRRSTDGGATWAARDAGTALALRGISASDAQHAWAVGDGGFVVATADGGVSWTRAQTSAARLHAVAFVDALHGIAVGQGGAIVVSDDGGATWADADTDSAAHLRALARVGASLAWAAGDAGTILRSSDGGASWTPASTPTTETLHAIAFRDASEGWAAGDAGTLLHSSDGGATWAALDAGTAHTLRGLSAFAGAPGWVVGEASVVLRVGAGSPDVQPLALPAVNLSIEPGRYWVHGVLCELEARCSYAQQADGGAGTRLPPGTHLLYLNAWQRHVSALQDPALREVALGGSDTATRARTLAQVRALALPASSPSIPTDWHCDSELDAWDALVGAVPPRLAARAEPQLASTQLCEIAATAGYRRLENQLYRVEVHDGGAAPTFKWSRENGSVEYAVVSLVVDEAAQQTVVRVAARGRDDNLDLAVHDRVELVDDDSERSTRAGTMFEYLADGDDALELVLAGVPAGTLGRDPARHPLLRRWDQRPGSAGEHVLPIVTGSWIDLEEGVQVWFEPGGSFRPGDHWLIPARTISADVEWPRSDDGDPLAQPPHGIADAYCRLGIVDVALDGTLTVLSDCRTLFPPLTALEMLVYGGGDGQDGPPNARLPQPLAVRVQRGALPLAGAAVRFEVLSGGGGVGPEAGPAGSTFEIVTDAQGAAACRWTLGPGLVAPARHQRVRASLLDAGGDAVDGQQIVFAASASLQLQYAAGDGQQAAGGAALPLPIEARVVHGGDGVAGVVLSASVSGGGAIVGPAALTTGPDGHAAFGWQLGAGGPQQLTVQLSDAGGNVVQRLGYSAHVASTGGGGGRAGCDVTIGPGGQFERLDSALLANLLERGRGMACLCFMPGAHEIDGLEAEGGRAFRLSLHGCGPTAVINLRRPLALAGFDSLELRDLAIQWAGNPGILLRGNRELRLAGVALSARSENEADLGLVVSGASRVSVSGCRFGGARTAAAVFEGLSGECVVAGNRFDGPVSFYGVPGDNRSRELIDQLRGSPPMRLEAGTARLHFVDNEVQLLTISAEMVEQLLRRAADGLFQSATLRGNAFAAQSNVFASGLLGFNGNSFLAQPDDGSTPYGALVALRAAAAGNVAARNGDDAIVHFLPPEGGGFSGAANQVFTLPQSIN